MQFFKQQEFWLSSELPADEALAVIKANTNLPTTFNVDLITIGKDRYFVGNVEGNSFEVKRNYILRQERMSNMTSIKGKIYADGAKSKIYIVVADRNKKMYVRGVAIFISFNIILSAVNHFRDIFVVLLFFTISTSFALVIIPIASRYEAKSLKKKLCELFNAKEIPA